MVMTRTHYVIRLTPEVLGYVSIKGASTATLS
jgi:hypothetical protein